MSFATAEESRFEGQPFELFRFQFGSVSTAVVGFTSAAETIEHAGVTYRPVPMSRNAVVVKQTLDKSELKVQTTRDHPIAQQFRQRAPAYVVSLTVFQGHHGSGDVVALWSGRVTSVSWAGSQATLNCEPVATAMRRVAATYNYQIPCQHVLYGSLCRADKQTATVVAEALEVLDSAVRLPGGWFGALDPAKFRYGYIQYQTPTNIEYRTILRVENSETLVLSQPPTGLSPGDSVTAVLGCDHSLGDCRDVHDNLPNYGGMPGIPTTNPINRNNHN